MPIIIAVKYRLKPGMREELLKFVMDNVTNSRKETGNLTYAHYPSLEDEQEMFVFESWETMEHLEAHKNAPHYLEFVRKRKPMLESFEYKQYDASLLEERS